METSIVIPSQGVISSLDKAAITAKAKEVAKEISDAGYGSLAYLGDAAKAELFFKELLSTLREASVGELNGYDKGQLMANGVQFVAAEAGVEYLYDSDPTWNEYVAKEAEIEVERKKWEKKLRALPVMGGLVVNPMTGEEYLAHRPGRSASDTVKISIL